MKILTVIGARPQFIKAIALSKAIVERPGVEEVLLHTGQHYDQNMSDVFFDELGLPTPKYKFDLGGGSHGEMTARQLIEIEKVLIVEEPDICVVYGDTNSTLAGALAAAKVLVPIAHIEAGLRSFNRKMPEETNRILTDHVSKWLFAPTRSAVDNLTREGFAPGAVHLVGDVMYDVTRLFIESPERQTSIVNALGLATGEFAVATVHRQENTDDPARLVAVLGALADLTARMQVVLPIHPRTAKMARQVPAAAELLDLLTRVDPLGFFDLATLLSSARLVVTDSGGLQKEAYFHGVPCVTARDETEWVELVTSGWNRLPKTMTRRDLSAAIDDALESPRPERTNAYGDGRAAEAILDVLCR